MSATVPYESANSGAAARDEITKLLRRFGCESVGFMDDFEAHSVMLAFKHRGRNLQLCASARGWAQMYLKAHPHTYRMRHSKHEHEQRALRQGFVAVNSILRDWVKGQVTAVECARQGKERLGLNSVLAMKQIALPEAGAIAFGIVIA